MAIQLTTAGDFPRRLSDKLLTRLNDARTRAAADPFTNPFLLFALELTNELETGQLNLDQIAGAVTELTSVAFEGRAERLSAYLGSCKPASIEARLTAMFTALADKGDFDAY